MQVNLSFGEYLRRLRRDKRMPLQDVARKAGLSTTHLSRLENDNGLRRRTCARVRRDPQPGVLPEPRRDWRTNQRLAPTRWRRLCHDAEWPAADLPARE